MKELEQLCKFYNIEKCNFFVNGTWSLKIVFDDLESYPVDKELILANLNKQVPYLEFFRETRGFEKEVTPHQKKVFDIFDKGSIMLYFENIFLYLLKQEEECELFHLMEKLSKEDDMSSWWNIIKETGAGSVNLFISDPLSYINNKTKDEEYLEKNNLELGYYTDIEYNIIGPDFNRTQLITYNSNKVRTNC